jgi:hypothetical protein
MPFERPVTTIGLLAPLTVFPPGETVTVYDVIGAPPSTTGGVNVTTAIPFPAVALTPVGAPGARAANPGVTLFDGADGTPVPIPFDAVTVNV